MRSKSLCTSQHTFKGTAYDLPFVPSFVSSRFHCRDEYMNTHLSQCDAMYLPNARSASIRQDDGPNVLKDPCYFVAFHCCSNLF